MTTATATGWAELRAAIAGPRVRKGRIAEEIGMRPNELSAFLNSDAITLGPTPEFRSKVLEAIRRIGEAGA